MTYPPNYNRWPPDGEGFPGSYVPPEQAPPPPKKPRWILYVFLAALLTVVIVACAAYVGRDQAKRGEPNAPAPTRTAQTTKAQPQGAVGKTTTKPSPTKKALPTKVSDGTFIVGKDVAAGEYKTQGADEGIVTLCTWTTSKDNSFNTVVDFGAVDKVKESGIVTLKKGQYFKTSGCQPWVRQ